MVFVFFCRYAGLSGTVAAKELLRQLEIIGYWSFRHGRGLGILAELAKYDKTPGMEFMTGKENTKSKTYKLLGAFFFFLNA